jgi:nitrogen fixation protein
MIYHISTIDSDENPTLEIVVFLLFLVAINVSIVNVNKIILRKFPVDGRLHKYIEAKKIYDKIQEEKLSRS